MARPRADGSRARPRVGWRVLYCVPGSEAACGFCWAADEAEGREMVRRLNAAGRGRLYWIEWWNTSSVLCAPGELP